MLVRSGAPRAPDLGGRSPRILYVSREEEPEWADHRTPIFTVLRDLPIIDGARGTGCELEIRDQGRVEPHDPSACDIENDSRSPAALSVTTSLQARVG
jgi:hypothetical protein